MPRGLGMSFSILGYADDSTDGLRDAGRDGDFAKLSFTWLAVGEQRCSILCNLKIKAHRDEWSHGNFLSHEDAVRDEFLACVAACFCLLLVGMICCETNGARLMRRFLHWIARLWAALAWLVVWGMCPSFCFWSISASPDPCVLDGPFRGDFGARSGPFSTIEWGTC